MSDFEYPYRTGDDVMIKRKALILDDDRGVRELMCAILKTIPSFAFDQIYMTDNPAKAADMALKDDYDIIISDIHLSSSFVATALSGRGGSGLEFVEKILEAKGPEHRSRIIVVSSDYERLEEASKMGVWAIKKPFEVSVFKDYVLKIISREGREKRTGAERYITPPVDSEVVR